MMVVLFLKYTQLYVFISSGKIYITEASALLYFQDTARYTIIIFLKKSSSATTSSDRIISLLLFKQLTSHFALQKL